VGLGEQKDMGFLRWGFIKSSSSSLPLADRGVSGGGCSSQAPPLSVGGPQFISSLEWSMFCSSMVFGDKGKEALTVAFLSPLDVWSIGGWIRLRVVSFRGWVSVEAVASCILRVY